MGVGSANPVDAFVRRFDDIFKEDRCWEIGKNGYGFGERPVFEKKRFFTKCV